MASGMNREKLTFFGVLALIVALVAGAFLVNALWQRTPGEDSPEAGFLRDMQVHHLQAVEMAMIIRDRTEDEQIKAMATDIAFSQTNQIGNMQGYLNVWDLNPTGSEPPMAWMDHDVDGLMPGMATDDGVALLRTLPVEQAETLFLKLMNRHHLAGVEMSEAIIDRSDNDDIVELANSMIRVQNAEVEIMNLYLTERGEEAITAENVDALAIEIPSASPVASPAATPEEHEGH
jgi:uncharacterized protein (DUF305 family)